MTYRWPPPKAAMMSDGAIELELVELDKMFKADRQDDEGAAGSPGEWMVERMDELETEQMRRHGCGRHGCRVKKPTGQAPNGKCKCPSTLRV